MTHNVRELRVKITEGFDKMIDRIDLIEETT